MKTPEQYLSQFQEYSDKLVGGVFWIRMSLDEVRPIIEAIQQDAFESGRVEAVRVLGECVSSLEELDWSYDHNSLDVLERREMAVKHATEILKPTTPQEK